MTDIRKIHEQLANLWGIAAIARANGMTLATNKVAEFGRGSELHLEDWEEGATNVV